MEYFIETDNKPNKKISNFSLKPSQKKDPLDEFSAYRIDFDSSKIHVSEKACENQRSHSVIDNIMRSLFNKKDRKHKRKDIFDRRGGIHQLDSANDAARSASMFEALPNPRMSNHDYVLNSNFNRDQEPEEITETPRSVEKSIEQSINTIHMGKGINEKNISAAGIFRTSQNPFLNGNYTYDYLYRGSSKGSFNQTQRDFSPVEAVKRSGDTFYFEYEENQSKSRILVI